MAEPNGAVVLSEQEQQLNDTVELLQERIAELELASEDLGWLRLGGEGTTEFTREFLRQTCQLARVMYLKNPLIRRAVDLQAQYVFGQGVAIAARDATINTVVQAFLDDPANGAELTSHEARLGKEVQLQTAGNLFLVLFVNRTTGRVRVRSLPIGEVQEIVCDPEDARTPWYYKRTWQQTTVPQDGSPGRTEPRTAYYPHWRYTPTTAPTTYGGAPVLWDTPVYHVKAGGLDDMRFGVPEVYPALDWARAYKSFLENVATLMAAYARFAGKLTAKGGARGVAAAKARIGSTYASGGTSAETNPAPVAGSIFIGAEGYDYQPFQLRGASVNPEDGRRLLLMVCAATGFPETFFGDVSVGTLATAKSLDRPTELRLSARQTLWVTVFRDILGYQVDWAVRAPNGALKGLGTIRREDDGRWVVTLKPDPEAQPPTDAPRDRTILVDFPSLTEHDVEQMVQAIREATTLDGQAPAGTLDLRLATRLLLNALGVEDVDAELQRLFPEDAAGADPDGEATTTEAREAARPVRVTAQDVADTAAWARDVLDRETADLVTTGLDDEASDDGE